MERYESYRKSEICCLGAVPSHWKSSRFKYHHLEEDECVGDSSDAYPLLSLTKEGVIFRDIESGKGKFPASFENYKVVYPDRLIFCLFDIDETPRTIGLSNEFGMITGAYKVFKTTRDLISRFSLYTFLTIDDVKGLRPYYTGLRKVVRPETFKSLEFTIPPLHEQEQIVAYLDEKTTLIDDLIAKTERKIALLKEKRTALINQAVTKGLDPSVEMKDSGVEWIGEIPRHWDKTKYKYHFQIKGGFPFDSELITNEPTEFPIIRIGNVTTGEIDVYYSGELSEKIPVVEKGEYVVSLTGDFTVRRWERRAALLNQRCGLVVPQEGVNERYLFYILPQSFKVLEETKYFTTLKNLANSEVEDIEFCCPPLHEQEQIVEYLDQQTSIIDTTITTEEKRIKLLKEYRQALISEVVTGKVKVTRDD